MTSFSRTGAGLNWSHQCVVPDWGKCETRRRSGAHAAGQSL